MTQGHHFNFFLEGGKAGKWRYHNHSDKLWAPSRKKRKEKGATLEAFLNYNYSYKGVI